MRILLLFFANISIIILCVVGWFISIERDEYKKNFNSGVERNREYLKKTYGDRRVILLGGSSVAFALSAEKLSEDLGITVRNTARSAAYGMKNIWELHKDFLDPKKDIIVLSPEYELMKDLYLGFSNRGMCQLLYVRGSLELLLKNEYCASFVMKQVVKDSVSCFKEKKKKEIKKDNEVYIDRSTNEYGDIISHYGKESTYSNNNGKRIDASILQGSKDAYIEFVKKNILEKGFRIIYVPVTIERSRIKGIEKEIEEVQSDLLKFFGGEKEDIKDIFLYDEQYFFDTEYHPTYEGRMKKHPQVKKIIERELKKGKVQKVL